jgi:hypothetical protein
MYLRGKSIQSFYIPWIQVSKPQSLLLLQDVVMQPNITHIRCIQSYLEPDVYN